MKILVVDDDALVREVTADILSEDGFEVATAPDGDSALALASENEYDVAVVDLEMPGLSGADTVRRLKGLRPENEIIVFAGSPALGSAIETLRDQVFDYIRKPTGTAALAAVVQLAAHHRHATP